MRRSDLVFPRGHIKRAHPTRLSSLPAWAHTACPPYQTSLFLISLPDLAETGDADRFVADRAVIFDITESGQVAG